MSDQAQSILDRLKAKARKTSKSYQLHLQLFCQEEFLRRLQHSRYNGNFVLKGGLFLYCISGFESRPTMDIDFLIQRLPNDAASMKDAVRDIIKEDASNDLIRFEIKGIDPIVEHREYNGLRVKLLAIIKSTRTPFHIDMGIGDVIIPRAELRSLPTQLEGFVEPQVMTYSLESTISEKFDAIISRMELGSRMKDYYDIYYLASTYTFDARKLQEAVFATLQKRGTNYTLNTVIRVCQFDQNQDMQTKWRQFVTRTEYINVGFREVLQTINQFIAPVFNAIVNESEVFGTWNPKTLRFE